MPVSTLFVGIDVSLKTNQVCSVNFNQDVFFNKKFDNSPSGTDRLISSVLDVLNNHQELSKVIFCLEATNVYHIHLASSLAMDSRLSAFNPARSQLHRLRKPDSEVLRQGPSHRSDGGCAVPGRSRGRGLRRAEEGVYDFFRGERHGEGPAESPAD